MNKFLVVLALINMQHTGLWSQTTLPRSHEKDWFKLDPAADSIAGIGLYKALPLLQGRHQARVIVAIIDNGVDLMHNALHDHIWTNKNEIAGNGIDDDHNGYIDDIHGWNFRGATDGSTVEAEQAGATQIIANSTGDTTTNLYTQAKAMYLEQVKNNKDSFAIAYAYNTGYLSWKLIANDDAQPSNRFYGTANFTLTPRLSHGTHVAGIVASIDPTVIIMPVVAATAIGDERDKDVANAIRYAVDNGAQIINMSFSKVFSSNKQLVDDAVQYAEKKNVLIVHCAGNDGVNIDSAANYHYPIAIDDKGRRAKNFITVGWNRPLFDYRLAHPYGNYGKANVDLYAPGSDIWSTVPGNQFDFKSGSSMSTPMVTGAAALLLSYFPSLTAVQVKHILIASVFKPQQTVNLPQTNIPVPFSSLSASGGILNLYNAIKLAEVK